MEKVWHHIFYDQLRVSPEDYPCLITESIFNPNVNNRAKMTEIMFEEFKVPGLSVYPSAVQSLFAAGRTTGLVLESGEGISQTVPIYEGNAITYAVHKMMLAGRELTAYLLQKLQEQGLSMTTYHELQIVKKIKETLTEVTSDFNKAMNDDTGASKASERIYRLLDGQNIQIGKERFRCPELLF